MSPYVSKFRGSDKVVACYVCPVDGEFDCEVERDANGDAPEVIPCPLIEPGSEDEELRCGQPATWTPSASIGYRVRRVEVVRGKWEKPERKTYLDTRKLGEGQSVEEFQAERKKVWRERRLQTVKDLLR